MSDPWLIDRPTILAVSGGRSSMHMLWRYLDRHDGRLPEFAVPVFCNTGMEHPKTLNFVQRCSAEWGCRIVWLEYRDADEPGDRWCEVSHNEASRNGEPYRAANRRKTFLPNQVNRTCTTELKIHCTHRWARAAWEHGAGRYLKAVGFRSDEGRRVMKASHRCKTKKDAWDLTWPLYDAGVNKAAVLDWWSRQSFDLWLEERHGNCTLCFLKARWKLAQNIEEQPDLADWWIEEQVALGGFFRSPKRPMHDYRDILAWALSDAPKPWKQGEMLPMDALDIECACTD